MYNIGRHFTNQKKGGLIMKKTIIGMVVLACAVFFLSGCAGSSNDEAVADELSEKIIEDATGSKVDISNNGNDVTITSEDGNAQAQVGENLGWPSDKVGDLPELTGNIVYIGTGDDGGTMISLENVKQADAEAYLQKILDLGYTGTNMSDDTEVFFMGKKDGKDQATFQYSFESGEATIMFLAVE